MTDDRGPHIAPRPVLTCEQSIRYAPTDGETGRDLPEVHVRCTLTTGHTGFHMGNDRMPFGPWVEPSRVADDRVCCGHPECADCNWEDPGCPKCGRGITGLCVDCTDDGLIFPPDKKG